MSEETEPTMALIPTDHREFFHEGTGIEGYQVDDDWYIAMRQVCRVFELDWSAQRQRIMRDPILTEGVRSVQTTTAGGVQDTLCLRADLFWGWLFRIDLGRISPDVRDKLIPFQRAGYEALYRHFTGQPSATTSTDLEARVAALEAAAAHAALPYARSLRTAKVSHPQSQAILAVLRESAAPLSAHQIWATLTARGATAYTAKYYTVRLRRLDRTGAVRRVGHGLYVAAETLELAPYAPATPWGGES